MQRRHYVPTPTDFLLSLAQNDAAAGIVIKQNKVQRGDTVLDCVFRFRRSEIVKIRSFHMMTTKHFEAFCLPYVAESKFLNRFMSHKTFDMMHVRIERFE